MNDIISRQAAIDKAMELVLAREKWNSEEASAEIRGINALICEVIDLPSAQKWIPCSKRMPEKPGKYLVTVKNGNVYAGTFDVIDGKFQCAATAWMPLPEPYKGEQ